MNKETYPSFLQTPSWAQTNRNLGRTVYTYSTSDDSTPNVVAIVRDARRGRYLEIPAGPLINWLDQAAVTKLFTKLISSAKSRNCVFIRFRPQLHDTDANHTLLSSALAPVLTSSGATLRPAKMHLAAQNTVILDLTLSEEDLLMSFRRQTRYEVRRADKQGIIIKEDSSPSALKSFHALQSATAKRQGFIPPSLKELEAERAAFKEDFHLFSAYLPDDTLLCSGLFLSSPEEAAYFEAASSELARKYPGAYALIWHAAKFYKALNVPRLNLFGIAPPNSPNHRYAGVTTFKTGFGEPVNFLPAEDIVLDKLRYKLTDLIETSRKKKRNL